MTVEETCQLVSALGLMSGLVKTIPLEHWEEAARNKGVHPLLSRQAEAALALHRAATLADPFIDATLQAARGK
jgi:hypothetical protein